MTAAPIKYDRPIKNLIAGLDATGHVTHKSYKKKSVTLHHNGGRLSHEGVLNVWKTRPASAHFDSDKVGDIAQYVGVQEYAWAVGNTTGNVESVSIEMCNSELGPKWTVAEATWKSAARLAGWLFAHVIDGRPRPSKDNLFYHHHWKATECAGPYMDSIYSQVLAEAQRWYDTFRKVPTPTPVPSRPAPRPTDTPGKKSIATVAKEVIAGKWGNGSDRRRRITAAGYSYQQVQAEVNRQLGARTAPRPSRRKSIQTIAQEVIAGKWGNGEDRMRRLHAAGYDFETVQREVNRRLLGR